MNPRFLLPILLLIALSSCKTRKYSRNNRQIEKEAKRSNPDAPNYTTLSYIESFKGVAIEEMNLYGIPASITLAQGIIESGSGNSSLARYANNHFGVKCTSEWKGKGYYKDDDQRNDCFRVYKDARQSYKDHSEFLKRKRYSFLFQLDKNDYKNWAYGLKQAGYATNPKYPDMLISTIEKYQLYKYDQPESERQKIIREDRVFTEINANIPKETKKFTPVDSPPSQQVISTKPDSNAVKPDSNVVKPDSATQPQARPQPTSAAPAGTQKYYMVKQGDTLYNISKRFNLSIEDLKTLNNLNDTGIKIGQVLLIVNNVKMWQGYCLYP